MPFPSVSICHDTNSWKWPGIVKAMTKLNTNDTIKSFFLNDQELYWSLKSQMAFGFLAFKKTSMVEEVKDKTSRIFVESLWPQEFQSVGQLVHYICFAVGQNYQIRAFTNALIDILFYFKLNNLPQQEIGTKLEEHICTWQTTYFNATEYCLDWNNDTMNNQVRLLNFLIIN